METFPATDKKQMDTERKKRLKLEACKSKLKQKLIKF